MDKIKGAFCALTEVVDPAGHDEYRHWHSTDHIPENRALAGVLSGARWFAPPRAGRGPPRR